MDKIFKNNKELFYKGILVILLIPFIISSFYTYPSIDDYSMYNNLVTNSKGWFDGAISIYLNWQGTYTANFILSAFLNGFGFNMLAIRILLSLITTFFFYSIYRLLKTIFEYFELDYLIFYLIFLVIVFIGVNSVSYNEAFFWFVGSTSYTLPFACGLFGLNFFINFLKTNKKPDLILSSIFGFISVGSALVMVASICSFYLVLLIYKYVNSKEIKIYYAIPFIMTLVGVVINILSPGNFKRIEIFDSTTSISNIILFVGCLKWVVKRFLNLIENQYLISGLVITIFLLFKSNSNKKLNINPLVMIILPTLIPYVTLFPFIFGYKSLTYFATRAFFILDVTIVLTLLAYVIYTALWVKQRYSIKINKNFGYFISVVVLIINLIFANPTSTPYFIMIKELTNGTLKNALKTNTRIMNEIEISSEQDYVITEEFVATKTLINHIITEDPNFWVNMSIAEYYNKNTITYKPNK